MKDKQLASKGRFGDTEIRNIDGHKSHVNKLEAAIIDTYGKNGEKFVESIGSGTINPNTGLKEYDHEWWHAGSNVGRLWNKYIKPLGKARFNEMSYGYKRSPYWNKAVAEGRLDAELRSTEESYYTDFDRAAKQFDEEAYQKAIEKGTHKDYLSSIGIGKEDIDIFDTGVNLKQLRAERGEAETAAQATYGLGVQSAQAEYDIGTQVAGEHMRAGEEAFGLGKQQIGESRRQAGEQYRMGASQAGLGARGGLMDIRRAGSVGKARSGLASAGQLSSQIGSQSKGVWQEYMGQKEALGAQRTGAFTAADLQSQQNLSAWEGIQGQYGTGGTYLQGLTESRRSALAGLGEARRSSLQGAQLGYQSDLYGGVGSFWDTLSQLEGSY